MLDTILAILGWSAFGLAVIIGLVLNLIGLFGNWILLGAVAIAWALTGFNHFNVYALVIIALLALAGEGVEMLAGAYGAKRFGGSKGAMVAAIIGCFAGAFLMSPMLFPLGTMIGAIVGSFVGAALQEFIVMQRHPEMAAKVGFGAALGKVAGMFAKLFFGFAILGVAAWTF